MASFKQGTNDPYYTNTEPLKKDNGKYVGVAALLGGTGFIGAGFIPTANGNVFDTYYKIARIAGQASPMGLAASLRVPEAMSPFLSQQFQSNNRPYVEFSEDYLNSRETLRWVSRLSGQSETQLTNLGFGTGSSMRFTRHTGWRGFLGSGSLSLVTSQGHSTNLSDDIMLLDRNLTSGEVFSTKRTVNQFTDAVGSVVDENINLGAAFLGQQNGVVNNTTHKFIPAPAMTGAFGRDRFAYIRGLFAFEAQRLNRATETIVENVPIIGDIIRPYLNTEGLLVKNGPALKTYGRYLGVTSKLGAVGIGIAQYDYFMRYKMDNPFLKEMAFAASSAALGYGVMSRLGKSSTPSVRINAARGGLGIATGAFLLQNMFSGFDKGSVAGAVKTGSDINIARSKIGEFTGASDYRRQLEDIFPGITDTSTGVFAGLTTLAVYSIRHRDENRYLRFYRNIDSELNQRGLTGLDKLRTAFTDLDLNYDMWEKVSANLTPADDINAYRAAVASGTWTRSTIPGKDINDAFETTYKNLKASGAGLNSKLSALFQHFSSSSFAEYKGWKGNYVAFLLGFGIHAAASRKLFGSIETPEQLQRRADGEELVPIRKSRFWGAGGTPFEGGKIAYYKPSTTASVMADSENYAKWGEDVKRYSPITRWFLQNFTYTLEEKNYSDRPYPISSPAFANTPFFGELLGSTIGSIIKPPKLMHTDEWMRTNEEEATEYLNVPKKLNSNPYLPLGGSGVGRPQNPYAVEEVLADTQYRLREASGLIGFVKNTIQKMITGDEVYTSRQMLLAESGSMYDTAKSFWELELGGAATLSEIPRRFFPKERTGARDRYNPIKNSMPDWLPEELRRGDPYRLMPSGHSRLPGAGYAALHPELQGISPDNYPLFYRYQILSNVAPYSEEYRRARIRILSMRKKGELPPDVDKQVSIIEEQAAQQRLKRNYFIESEEQEKQPYFKRSLRNSYLSLIDTTKDILAPAEYLVFGGFRPSQKFLPTTTALKDYERYSILGSETSFWDFSRAWQDYLGPSFRHSKALLGFNGVPSELKEKRDINEYFDKLTYYKYTKLAEEAFANGNNEAGVSYRRQAQRTVFGVNPYGHPLSIYAALPQAEKDRFDGFVAIKDPKDRQRLLEILPEDQKHIFAAIWEKKDGIKSSKKAQTDKEKLQELDAYFKEKGIPREDFIGWHPNVDLNDVKLKYIQSLGYSMFDFGFWPNDEEMLLRKPYLEGSEEYLVSRNRIFENQTNKLFHKLNVSASHTNVIQNHGAFAQGKFVTTLNDNRESDIRKEYKKWNED